MNLLSECLQNIQKELKFFADVAREYELDLEQTDDATGVFAPNQATQRYIQSLSAFGEAPELGLLQGLVLLWATEYCYLSAWKYARSHLQGDQGQNDLDGGALRHKFIPNWTSEEFEQFVAEIAEVTNLSGEQENAVEGTPTFARLYEMWEKVL